MTKQSAPVAAIDCGTNSIRLLIAQPQADGTLQDLYRTMEIVRLGYGVDRTGKLDEAAIERTLKATSEYAAKIKEFGVEKIRFAATSATRDASNREVFISGVREILGIEPEVITGEEEAKLSYQGAVLTLPDAGIAPRLVIDIGGGSTEFVLGETAPTAQISMDMGSVRITERHLGDGGAPSEAQIAAAITDIDALIYQAGEVIDFSQVRTIVGVAGTVTTMTAVGLGHKIYTPEASHGAKIPVQTHIDLAYEVLRESAEERAKRPAIHPGRIDVIGAGALIWARILEKTSQVAQLEPVITSEHDILDGIAMSIAGQN